MFIGVSEGVDVCFNMGEFEFEVFCEYKEELFVIGYGGEWFVINCHFLYFFNKLK